MLNCLAKQTQAGSCTRLRVFGTRRERLRSAYWNASFQRVAVSRRRCWRPEELETSTMTVVEQGLRKTKQNESLLLKLRAPQRQQSASNRNRRDCLKETRCFLLSSFRCEGMEIDVILPLILMRLMSNYIHKGVDSDRKQGGI